MASTKIVFTLNNNIYCIERTIRNNAVKRNIKFEDVILYKLLNDSKEIIHQKDNAVSKCIESNIGYSSTYLMSTMLTQNSDNDFFSLDNSKQKELLDNILSLNHINALKRLLKDSTTYYKNSIELLESYVDGIKSNTKVVDQKYIDDLERSRVELNKIQKNKDDLFTKWNMISQYDLSKYSDIKTLENTIDNIQSKLKKLPNTESNKILQKINTLDGIIKNHLI
jgi:DNA repair exonuclease SbcCD ATPase subunit